MSVSSGVTAASVRIRSANLDRAYENLRSWLDTKLYFWPSKGTAGRKKLDKAKSLQQLLESFDYVVKQSSHEIQVIALEGDREDSFGEEDMEIWEVLAPFIERASFLQYHIEHSPYILVFSEGNVQNIPELDDDPL